MLSNDETFMFKGKDDYARTTANFTSFFSKRSEFVRLRAAKSRDVDLKGLF